MYSSDPDMSVTELERKREGEKTTKKHCRGQPRTRLVDVLARHCANVLACGSGNVAPRLRQLFGCGVGGASWRWAELCVCVSAWRSRYYVYVCAWVCLWVRMCVWVCVCLPLCLTMCICKCLYAPVCTYVCYLHLCVCGGSIHEAVFSFQVKEIVMWDPLFLDKIRSELPVV